MSFIDRALSLLSEKERDTFSQELVDKAKRYGISIEDIRKLDKVSQLERLINKKIKEKDEAWEKEEKAKSKASAKEFKSRLNQEIKDAKWSMKHDIDPEDRADAAPDLADVIIQNLKASFKDDYITFAKQFNINKESLADSIYG